MPILHYDVKVPERYDRRDNGIHVTIPDHGEVYIFVPERAMPGDTLQITYHDWLLTKPEVLLLPSAKPQKGILKSTSAVQVYDTPMKEPSVLQIQADCFIFLDLENLAFLATNLQPLSLTCNKLGVELRTYTSPDHDWAERATHKSRSNKREAADVRMVIDATRLIDRAQQLKKRCRILLITDDLFGPTLAAEEPDSIACVAYSAMLPKIWLGPVFGQHCTSVEEYFQSFDVVRERRGRSESQSRSQSRGRSQSRDCSQTRDRSASRTRASWSRVASEHNDEPGALGLYQRSKSQLRTETHLLDKVDRQREEIYDLQHQVSLLKKASVEKGGLYEEALRGRRQAERDLDELRDLVQQVGKLGAALPMITQTATQRAVPPPPPPPPAAPPRRYPQRRRRGPRRWPRGLQPTPGKYVGNVKLYKADKGFGFIRVNELHEAHGDIFFHVSSIACDCEPNATLTNWDVELRVEMDQKKPGRMQAKDVCGPNGRLIPLSANLS